MFVKGRKVYCAENMLSSKAEASYSESLLLPRADINGKAFSLALLDVVGSKETLDLGQSN